MTGDTRTSADGVPIKIQNDDELFEVVHRYLRWSEINKGGSGLEQMMLLLVRCLTDKVSLRGAIQRRLHNQFDEMLEWAKGENEHLHQAFSYIAKAVKTDSASLDYDERFYYFMCFCDTYLYQRTTPEAFPDSEGLSPEGKDFNAYYFGNFSFNAMRMVTCYELLQREDISHREKSAHSGWPIITLMMAHQFNIPTYVDHFMNAWGEGAELAMVVYEYVLSERGRGQLSNLRSPTAPDPVDWARNLPWIRDRRNEYWIVREDEAMLSKADPRFFK